MTSNRPKHIEPSSSVPTGSDTIQARAIETPSVEQSEAALMKPRTLSIDPERLMEQIVDQANIERAWKNVRANRGAPGPDGISIAAFPEVSSKSVAEDTTTTVGWNLPALSGA